MASTKAFTSQVMLAAMVALYLGRIRDLSFDEGTKIVQALKELPNQIREILDQSSHIAEIAKKYARTEDFLFLGRQLMFPIAYGRRPQAEGDFLHSCRRLPGC